MNQGRLAAIAIAMFIAASPAMAHEEDGRGTVWSWFGDWDPSFYAGASLQQSTLEDWSTIEQVDSASFTSRESDDEDTGFRVAGGMAFAEHFAVEMGYADFGSATFAGNADGTGFWEPGMQRETIELSGLSLHLVGRLPVTSTWFVSGRVGAWSFRSERHQTGAFDNAGTPTPFDIRDSVNSTRFGYGAALEYDGLAPWRIAVEYDVAEFEGQDGFDDGQLTSLGLSLKYVFSRPAGE